MGGDRLCEDEWLVRDGAAKVLFCALAWTLAQWAGSGRIKPRIVARVDRPEGPFDDILDMPLFNALGRLDKLLKCTVDKKSRGFGGHARQSDRDASGIRALVRQDHLTIIPLRREEEPLLPAFTWLIASIATPDAVPHESLVRLFKSILIAETFADVCDIPANEIDAVERFAGTESADRARSMTKGLDDGLGGLRAPLARMLIGSTGSVERTTLADYEAGVSLDQAQRFDQASEDKASPLPIRLLVRLARIFGFSPVGDDAANIKAIEAALDQMSTERRAVWEAFCGCVDGKAPLRGGSGVDFVTCFEDALTAGHLNAGGFGGVVIEKQSEREAKSRKARPAVPPDAGPWAPALPAQLNGIIVNALGADPDAIGMSVDLRLDDGRIVLRSIRYQLDQDDAEEEADLQLCLRRIVTRWDWRESIRAALEDDCEAALRQSIMAANPGLKINDIETDTAAVRFSVGPAQPGEALPPRPDIAVERLALPRASYQPDDTATHRFELHAYWKDVALLQRRADASSHVFDRAALRDLLDERDSATMLLREYYAQIEHRFPTDGRLHLLGIREAKLQRQDRPATVSVLT